MKSEAMTTEAIESILSEAIEEAVDFIESEIAPDRIKAQRYFDGEVDIGFEEGRSKVVATKARDTVRAIKPSLMRVFLSTDKPVEFVPRGQEDVPGAEQATQFVHWKFNELNGYRILNDVFHDALIKRAGIAKVFFEETSDVEINTFSDLSDEEFAIVVNDPDVEVIEHSENQVIGPMGMVTTHDLKVSYQKSKGEICIESIPPEEFFVDRNARSLEDAYVCGHSTEMRVADLVEMGFDFDDVVDLGGSRDDVSTDEAEEERRGHMVDDEDENPADPSMKKVLVTEAYMRMDCEGTGKPSLYSFICGGPDYKLLSKELADNKPFAVFEVDPEPHAFFGRSIVDLVMEDQDAATAMLRGVLDNVAMTNMPRTAVQDGDVNMDDLLNNEIGGVVRTKGAPANSLFPLTVPFTAGSTLPALQYFDSLVENKTGVSRASMGLDPDAMQSTTRAAVTATITAAAGQTEVIARNLAEGGMRQMFKLMLKLMHKHSVGEEMMRISGKFTPVDPRAWNTSMDLTVNVGLGTGREEEKAMALRETLQMQMNVWQAYGPTNGIVTLTNIRNTLADMLASTGIRNSDRYFSPMDAEREQQLMQEAAQAAQGQQQPDPNAGFIQAEQIKAQTKLQSDQVKYQLDAQKMAMEDDRKRDEMDMDMVLKAADLLGKYGVQVDKNEIQRLQAAPR